MFKISDFARLSCVSAKMLRHYDEIGLLKPAYVDPVNEYRYYAADQLPRLNRIVVLKELGFTLEQIARLLKDDLPADQIKGMLKLRRAEVEQLLHAQQARLVQIEARLNQIEREGQLPSYEVVLRSVQPMRVASAYAVVSDDKEIAQLLHEVETYVAGHKARAAGPPLVVYHECEDLEQEVEVAVPVQGAVPDDEQVAMNELPAVTTMACVVHTGNYDAICQAGEALCRWAQAQGYDLIGPSREVYLRFSAPKSMALPAEFLARRPGESVTELQFPVAKA
jgi:DNA-binding transcriptional MerR regulator